MTKLLRRAASHFGAGGEKFCFHIGAFEYVGYGFTLNAAPPAQLVAPGQAAAYTLDLRPIGGFSATLTLTKPFFLRMMTGTAGAATQMAVNAGDGQSATVGTAVTTPPSVIVRDASGEPTGLLKEAASLGGKVDDLVPKHVAEALNKKVHGKI